MQHSMLAFVNDLSGIPLSHPFNVRPFLQHKISFIRLCWDIGLLLLALIFYASSGVSIAQSGFEEPPVLKAQNILKPSLLKSELHTVATAVKNDGLFNHYQVNSKFGNFNVQSNKALALLIHEIHMIDKMRTVKTEDTALKSAKQSGKNLVIGIKSLVTQPEEALQGAATGVSSLFTRATGTIGKRKTTDAEDSKLEQVIGVTKSKGLIANQYNVNIYSRNLVLQDELNRLARADYLGGIGVSAVQSMVPGAGGLLLSTSTMARLLKEAINTTPASELWLQNKNKLLSMGVDTDIVELFLNNPVFSPDLHTVIVAALEQMPTVANRKLFIKVALQASSYEMARTITEICVMSAGYHKSIAKLKSFALFARVVRASRIDGGIVILLPVDYIAWTPQIRDTVRQFQGQFKKTEKPNVEVWLSGELSQRTKDEIKALGWKFQTQAANSLKADKAP